jgi:ATP-dependent Clp protease adaptor protein ClpS
MRAAIELTLPTIGASMMPPRGADDDRKGGKGDGGSKNDTATITKPKTKTKRPSLYRVLLLNDDYTPMEFVVLVLQDVFNKTREEAMRIMLHVHQKGVGECGVYPYEVAETKVTTGHGYGTQEPASAAMRDGKAIGTSYALIFPRT